VAASIIEENRDRRPRTHNADHEIERPIAGHILRCDDEIARWSCKPQRLMTAFRQLNLDDVLRVRGTEAVQFDRCEVRVTVACKIRHRQAQRNGARGI